MIFFTNKALTICLQKCDCYLSIELECGQHFKRKLLEQDWKWVVPQLSTKDNLNIRGKFKIIAKSEKNLSKLR